MNLLKTTFNLLSISLLGNIAILSAQSEDVTPPTNIEKKQESHLSGTVYFVNGDSVTGQIIDWNLDNITLSSPDFIEPITFVSAHVLNIILDDQESSKETDEHSDLTSLIIQHRGKEQGLHGVIKGSFANIDDTHVTLNTSYAGEIKVLKKFITKMEVDSKKGYLYSGPKSLEEWYNNNTDQYWSYSNQSLIAGITAGNIAQDIKLPEHALISFELSWKNQENLELLLYSSDPEASRPDDYYKLSLRPYNNVTMYKYLLGRRLSDLSSKKKDERRLNLDVNRNQNLRKKNLTSHYDIYMSKKEGVFHIFRNGSLLDTWTDNSPKPNSFGSAIHLISSNRSPIRVKNLTLSKWSGHLPSQIDQETFAKLKGKGQRILLKNGDILLGQIGTLKDGLMEIETLYTPIRLPIIRMRSIDLTADKIKDQPIKYFYDIKCWFKDKGWIILKPISIDGKKLTAYHQALGENEFNLDTFKRIDLNIYTNNHDQLVPQNDW